MCILFTITPRVSPLAYAVFVGAKLRKFISANFPLNIKFQFGYLIEFLLFFCGLAIPIHPTPTSIARLAIPHPVAALLSISSRAARGSSA